MKEKKNEGGGGGRKIKSDWFIILERKNNLKLQEKHQATVCVSTTRHSSQTLQVQSAATTIEPVVKYSFV